MTFDSRDTNSAYEFGDATSPANQLADALGMFDNSGWIVTTGRGANSGASSSGAKTQATGDKTGGAGALPAASSSWLLIGGAVVLLAAVWMFRKGRK